MVHQKRKEAQLDKLQFSTDQYCIKVKHYVSVINVGALDFPKKYFELVYNWSTTGLELVYTWSTTGLQLVYNWSTTDLQLVYYWSTTGLQLVCN